MYFKWIGNLVGVFRPSIQKIWIIFSLASSHFYRCESHTDKPTEKGKKPICFIFSSFAAFILAFERRCLDFWCQCSYNISFNLLSVIRFFVSVKINGLGVCLSFEDELLRSNHEKKNDDISHALHSFSRNSVTFLKKYPLITTYDWNETTRK